MPDHNSLFPIRLGHALREAAAAGYGRRALSEDVLAGLMVFSVTLPLALALAIASGVSAQYGLYSAIIAGFIIPLLGGSRFSISAPSAALVVVLYPIPIQYGLAGVLFATVGSGILLLLMAVMRVGRFIEYIPAAVILGLTAGIAVVLATWQLKDLFGLQIDNVPVHYLEQIYQLMLAAESGSWPSMLVAACTLWIMASWPKWTGKFPPHCPALVIATLLGLILHWFEFPVDTIGQRFHYLDQNGLLLAGIPDLLPGFSWPWLMPAADGASMAWSSLVVTDLLTAAFALAVLVAIESLLCAAALDRLTGFRHSANTELFALGVGNLVVPFFAGLGAAASQTTSVNNVRSGAQSPIAAMVQALLVLLALMILAPWFSYIPMPAIAALLLWLAWQLCDFNRILDLINTGAKSAVLVFVICFSLTVLFEMAIAISGAIILAALLFVKEVAAMTKVNEITANTKWVPVKLAPGCKVFRVNGPLFFAAAERVFFELKEQSIAQQQVILLMDAVSVLDEGGLIALDKYLLACDQANCHVLLVDLQFSVMKTLAQAKIRPVPGLLSFFPTLPEALAMIPKYTATDKQDLPFPSNTY